MMNLNIVSVCNYSDVVNEKHSNVSMASPLNIDAYCII